MPMRTRLPELLKAARRLRARLRGSARHAAARLHRAMLPHVEFIGITGSAGKTTTKHLAAGILAAHGPCTRSPGTGNEHYDVERAILATHRNHRYSIVELSASAPGYLDRSLRALRPTIGVITVVAREHYSAFGGCEAIAAEKGKVVEALPASGTAVLNIDDPLLRAIGERCAARVVWVGRAEGATLQLVDAHSSWPDPLVLRVRHGERSFEVRTRLHGTQLALPVLAALGIADAAGIRIEDAIGTLEGIEPMQGRMSVEGGEDGVTFVRDDWKAPQWSLQAPLEFLGQARARRRIAVIGTISDSPRSPSQRYAHAARQALEVADLVVLVGVDARAALKADGGAGRVRAFAHLRDASAFLREALQPGDLVLLKGTNKQDHLARIALDRRRTVRCWRSDCGRVAFCGSCALLETASGPPSGSHAAQGAAAAPQDAAPAGASVASDAGLLVVGLGNPFSNRDDTPHNVGYRMLDRLARAAGGTWSTQPEGLVSRLEIGGGEVELLKPGAAMNASGAPVRQFLARTRRTPAHCVIVHDDMDIALGAARTKSSGGDGGHKGLRSIIAAFGTDEFARVRIGVRRVGDTRKANELVLAEFTAADLQALDAGLESAGSAIRALSSDYSKRSGRFQPADG